jgi:hypothetical protein
VSLDLVASLDSALSRLRVTLAANASLTAHLVAPWINFWATRAEPPDLIQQPLGK